MLIKKSTAHKSNSSATVFSSKHVHSLIDCTFPKGKNGMFMFCDDKFKRNIEAGTCKACDLPIKRNAFVCKGKRINIFLLMFYLHASLDFCGYICHKQCNTLDVSHIFFNSGIQ